MRKDTANARMNVKPTKVKTAAQVLQPQIVTRSTSGTHRGIAGVPPEPRRLGIGLARESGGVRKCVERRMGQAAPPSQVQQHQRVTRSTRRHFRSITGAGLRQVAATSRRVIAPPGHVWRTPRVIRNTVARHRRQSKPCLFSRDAHKGTAEARRTQRRDRGRGRSNQSPFSSRCSDDRD